MTSTFVVIGDLHLQHGHARHEDRLRALDQILTEQRDRPDLAAWLLLGDVFHQRSSIADRNALAPRLQAMAQRAPVVILQGNHDAPGDLAIFAELRAAWPLTLIATPQTLRVRCATGVMASIAGLPYAHKAALVAAGFAPTDVPAAARGPLADVVDQLVDDLAAARAAGDVTLVIGHLTVDGAVTSSGQPSIGAEIALAPDQVDRFHPAPVFFGHVHRAQPIGQKETAWYVGSVCRMDWAEVEPKAYQIVTFGARGWPGYVGDGPYGANGTWDFDVRALPVDVPPMWHVEGALTRDADGQSSFRGQVTRGPNGKVMAAPASWAGCEVRVRYTFRASERAALDHRVVGAGFVDAARLQLEPIAVPDAGLRAPDVATAQTLAAKVRAWCAANGATASRALLDKLAALERPDLETALTDLQQRLQETERGATGDVVADPGVDGAAATPPALLAQEALL